MKIIQYNQLSLQQKQTILQRPQKNNENEIKQRTREIIAAIKSRKDEALFAYAQQFDQVNLSALQVTADEINQAKQRIDSETVNAINTAYQQIKRFHQAQQPQPLQVTTCPGVICEKNYRAIQRIGLYVPGGTAPLVSTVLMLGVPAQIAGSSTVVLSTPPNKNGQIADAILVAAELCGIQLIFKAGGAQAIAAMAYGTETIPKVDKIFGPGNAYVTEAKLQVAEDPNGAMYDLPAGPSEVMVIADHNANPEFVAYDLLSQAEHGIDSQAVLITTSMAFAEQVKQLVIAFSDKLPRVAVVKQSLQHSPIIVVDTIEQAIALSNSYAPEHLILQVANCEQYKNSISAAGSVFLGEFTPEALGDYVTGSNHVLPTYGYARATSGLTLNDFMVCINFQTATQQGIQSIGPAAVKLAQLEGLNAHELAVATRLNYINSEAAT